MLRFGCSTNRLHVRLKPDATTAPWVVEKCWRRREISPHFADFLRKVGGGGGSRTRVRKHVVVGLYMRVRLLDFRARREEAAKYRRALSPVNLTDPRRGAMGPPAGLMAFDPQPPGEVRANVTA